MEEEIVKNYIINNKQERILWELSNPRKRADVYWKFAGPNIFKKNCLQVAEYMDSDELESKLLHMGKTDKVYYIGSNYIGELSLAQAVENVMLGAICVIYCGNGIGYYQGENDGARTPRFFLMQAGGL